MKYITLHTTSGTINIVVGEGLTLDDRRTVAQIAICETYDVILVMSRWDNL